MVGLAGANHAYDCAADRLEPPPGRRGAPAGRACREGVGLRRHNGADIGAKGNGCGSRVHAHEGSHHLVLSDADRLREASLAMKESRRQVKTASA